jgi:branched-chain amino acid transport system permease protein
MRENRLKSPAFIIPVAGLLFCLVLPLFQPSYYIIDLATKVLIFGIFAATFDVMVGYTGVLSFAHSMFFGFGAYSCALLFRSMPDSPVLVIVLAIIIATLLSIVVSGIMAFFSLRVVAIFFAMITLAFASFTEILAIEFSSITGGEDGITLQLPEIFTLNYKLGLGLSGQSLLYYFILFFCTLMLYLMLRFTNSPFGRVLRSIRENEDRSEALGYQTFHYKLFSIVFSCVLASYCGILFSLWLGFVSPESTLGIPITLNVLIMALIGGLGTIYGGIIGAFVLQLLEGGLPQLRVLAEEVFPQYPWLAGITGRWLLLFGLLFVLIVTFFPYGIMGWFRIRQLDKITKANANQGSIS